MHTHFVTHVTSPQDVEQLPCLLDSLQHFFPHSTATVYNQSLLSFPRSEMAITCENIKECGFGWTLRFLRNAHCVMTPGDLLIKVDPDTQILGNPLEGLEIPNGSFFGQQDKVGCCDMVFFGGFQGFTYKAVEEILRYGPQWENAEGPQDIILQNIVNGTLQHFVPVPNVSLWADRQKPLPPDLKVVHYSRTYA